MADDLEQAHPGLRASDQDRERTVEQLRRHVTDGSLTLDEFAERVDVALSARTQSELEPLVADLATAPVPKGRRLKARRWVIAVMGGSQAKGRWRVGGSVRVVAVMGGCTLDLRRAEIDTPEVRITAVAVWGSVDVIVPEGIDVELGGMPIMGGKKIRVADVPVLPGSPLISVRAFPVMGGVTVRSRPDRRTDEVGTGRGARQIAGRVPTEPPQVGAVLPDAGAGQVPAAADGTVTVMFSDIAGYSAITERLGDLAAHELLRTHNAIVRELVVSHGGREVKSQGDGFMVAFTSAARALRCAVAIEQAFDKYSMEHPEEPIRVHVGLDTGEPVRDGDDLLGRAVIVASRLTAAAGPDEILVSSLLHELAVSIGEFRFGQPRQIELKGMTGSQTAFPVEWRS